MAKVYLDTNVLIDLLERRKDFDTRPFKDQDLVISPVSIHIYIYIYKYRIPIAKLDNLKRSFIYVAIDEYIVEKSLKGPTDDFEDNVQLHSAAAADCDFFLTSDNNLLQMKFFGKTQLMKRLKGQ